jgi:hypothetical protein
MMALENEGWGWGRNNNNNGKSCEGGEVHVNIEDKI